MRKGSRPDLERNAAPFGALMSAGLFLSVVATAVSGGHLPVWILPLYLLASPLTFVVYGYDKSAARQGKWRVAEKTLHLMALCGGWPGALVARRFFRHKTRKTSFRFVFWLSVVLNMAVLLGLAVAPARQALTRLFPAMA